MASGAPSIINGRYRIERELGRGGIGVVYLARDLRLHEMPVVIKFLLERSTENPWLSRKFLQEAEALTRIHHPGVVRVIDRDQTPDGRSFFVMEYVNGVPLRSAIRPGGLDLPFAAAIVRDIGQALAAAHLEGVLHRDLKPENIMLATLSDGAQHARLIDFGIAKVQDSVDSARTELGTMAGSLLYMAPEQLLGQPASVASEVYAFAAIAYELLTGRRPYDPDAPTYVAAIPQLMMLQRSGQVIPPQQLRPEVPAAAQAIVLQGLAFDPAARVADARQFGDGLAQALLDPGRASRTAVTVRVESRPPEPPVAAPPDPPAPNSPPAAPPPSVAPATALRPDRPRSRPMLALAAAAGLVTIAGLTYLLTTWRSPVEPPALQQVATPAGSPAEERALTYSLTLQRDPRRSPGATPIQLAGPAIFGEGDRVRLAFTSPQGGHLYIFNEGPRPAGGGREVNVLFPSPTSNDGSSALDAGETVSVPSGGGGFFEFDRERGVEKLWIVWSRAAQPRLDAMKQWANPEHRGQMDAADVEALDAFLRAHEAPAPVETVDKVARTTTVRARGDVIVRLIELEHH